MYVTVCDTLCMTLLVTSSRGGGGGVRSVTAMLLALGYTADEVAEVAELDLKTTCVMSARAYS